MGAGAASEPCVEGQSRPGGGPGGADVRGGRFASRYARLAGGFEGAGLEGSSNPGHLRAPADSTAESRAGALRPRGGARGTRAVLGLAALAAVALLATVGMSAGWRGAGGPDGDAAGLLQERLHFQDVRYFAWSDKQVQAHVMQLEKELHAMAKSPVVSLHALAGDVQESARSLAPSEVRARLSGLLSKIAGASSRAAQGVDERVEAAIAPLPEQATVLRRTGQALEAADRRAMGAASSAAARPSP